MNTGRVFLIVTCLLVAVLGVWLAVVRWDDASKVATVVSALGAVAAVGVAIWAALRSSSAGGSVVVSRTGRATTSSEGSAITGLSGKAGAGDSVRVERTGDAESAGGDAVTGVQQD